MRPKVSPALLAGISAIALLFTAGCGGSAASAPQPSGSALAHPTDQKLISAAKSEGSVVVYGTSSVTALKSDADGFQQAYGFPVTFMQLTSSPLTARVDQEAKAGRINADIVETADIASLDRWAGTDLMTKLPDVKYPEKTDFHAPIQVVYQGLIYNTSQVAKKDVPQAWSDVLNSRFAGKIVLGSPRVSPAFSELYYAILHDSKYGQPFFDKLAGQKPRVVQTNVLVAQSCASGEASLGFSGLPFDAVNIKQNSPGAPVDYTYLDIVTEAPTYLSVTAKAQHPNAAKLYAEWMMSPAGQVAHNGEGRASSALGNLPGTLLAPDPKRVKPVTAADVSKEYQELIAMFDRLYK